MKFSITIINSFNKYDTRLAKVSTFNEHVDKEKERQKMKIGEKIKSIRKLRGMTQKELGLKSGFKTQSADVRIAQYESGTRMPKEEFRKNISEALNINSLYLSDHSIASIEDVLFALFDIDDTHGISISLINGEPCLMFNAEITKFLMKWYNMRSRLYYKEITEEEYLNWKFNYYCDPTFHYK